MEPRSHQHSPVFFPALPGKLAYATRLLEKILKFGLKWRGVGGRREGLLFFENQVEKHVKITEGKVIPKDPESQNCDRFPVTHQSWVWGAVTRHTLKPPSEHESFPGKSITLDRVQSQCIELLQYVHTTPARDEKT